MTQPEPASESPALQPLTEAPAALQTLRDEVRTLRSLFSAAALAFLLMSFGLNAYLYYQDQIVRKDLEAAKRMAREFETVRRPVVSTFVTRLQDFSRGHPDINPILDKYGIRPSAAPAPTPSAPAPTPPAAKPGK